MAGIGMFLYNLGVQVLGVLTIYKLVWLQIEADVFWKLPSVATMARVAIHHKSHSCGASGTLLLYF